MQYAKLIGRIALFTCEHIAHIEFYVQGLLPKILAIYTIKTLIIRRHIAFLVWFITRAWAACGPKATEKHNLFKIALVIL